MTRSTEHDWIIMVLFSLTPEQATAIGNADVKLLLDHDLQSHQLRRLSGPGCDRCGGFYDDVKDTACPGEIE